MYTKEDDDDREEGEEKPTGIIVFQAHTLAAAVVVKKRRPTFFSLQTTEEKYVHQQHIYNLPPPHTTSLTYIFVPFYFWNLESPRIFGSFLSLSLFYLPIHLCVSLSEAHMAKLW